MSETQPNDEDEQSEPSIERTVDEMIDALHAIEDDDGRYNHFEESALLWVLDTEYEHITPTHRHDVSIGVTAEEIVTEIESLDAQRTAAYKNQATRTGDGLAFAATALEWVLGENDAFDHVV